MQKFTTHRMVCKNHDLDKSYTFIGTRNKDGSIVNHQERIKYEMNKLGCDDYKTTSKVEELING